MPEPRNRAAAGDGLVDLRVVGAGPAGIFVERPRDHSVRIVRHLRRRLAPGAGR